MVGAKASERVRLLDRALHRLAQAERRFRQSEAAQMALGATDLDALLLLDESGAVSAGRVAEALALTTGAVTGLLDRLERGGWVQRTRHEGDRRQVLVELTPARRASIASHRARRESLLGEAAAAVDRATVEQATVFLEAAAERLLGGLRDDDAEESPSGDGMSAPIGDLTRATLRLGAGASQLTLRGARIKSLYRVACEGTPPKVTLRPDGTVVVQHKGLSWLAGRSSSLTVTLTSAVPWSIEVRGGVSQLDADLRELTVSAVEVLGGASRCALRLPRPHGHATLRVSGGANDVEVRRPRGVAAQAIVSGGASSLRFDAQEIGALGGTVKLSTRDYDAAADRWSIELSGGASGLRVSEE